MATSSSTARIIDATKILLQPPTESPLSTAVYASPLFQLHFNRAMLGQQLPSLMEEVSVTVFTHKLLFKVLSVEPTDARRVGKATRVEFAGRTAIAPPRKSEEFFIDAGDKWKELRETIRAQLEGETLFPFTALLLLGANGSGKSFLMQKAKSEFEEIANVEAITGKSPRDYRSLLARLSDERPKLFLVDDVSWRDSDAVESLGRLLEANVFIVATCTHSELKAFNESKVCGRFEKKIELQSPDQRERRTYISHFIGRIAAFLSERGCEAQSQTELEAITDLLLMRTPGLCFRELRYVLREIEQKHLSNRQIMSLNSVIASLGVLGGNVLRTQRAPSERVLFAQIGGYEDVKAKIRATVELPLTQPQLFVARGIRPSTGILLYGPPGCSKTMFAKAIACESAFTFFSVKGPELFSKYVGDSEQNVRELFRQARLAAPSVLFFDEIDALAARREKKSDVGERILTQLLTEMDGTETAKSAEMSGETNGRYVLSQYMQSLVVVVAATNRPETLDPAILRPGRFDELVYVPLPDVAARLAVLRLSTAAMPLEAGVDLQALAVESEGLSGAELVHLCKEAALKGIYEGRSDCVVTEKDLRNCWKEFKGRLSKTEIEKYEKFSRGKQ